MLSTKGLLDRCRTASSVDDDDQADGKLEGNDGPAAKWVEHTWSTFIARAEEEEVLAPQHPSPI